MDEVTAPVNIHKLFLWVGALIGIALVAASKLLKFGVEIVVSESMREFLIDIVFESGVALIGAALTAYLLGILLNNQQENAAKWRTALRQKISEAGYDPSQSKKEKPS
jgi:hypothetical protein